MCRPTWIAAVDFSQQLKRVDRHSERRPSVRKVCGLARLLRVVKPLALLTGLHRPADVNCGVRRAPLALACPAFCHIARCR